jgi:predicted metal-binding protein
VKLRLKHYSCKRSFHEIFMLPLCGRMEIYMSGDKGFQESIDEFIYAYPVCEFYYLTPDNLIFSDKVRTICELGCPHYGSSWACPPGIGDINSCIKECRKYRHVFLFTSIASVPDCLDFTACLNARGEHERMTRDIRKQFELRFGKVLALSTGCMLCDTCTYPLEACRHPQERLSTIESHGILIMETASRLGVTLDCGNDIVTYISLIFFNE